jgi:DNA-binding SARP family transcriptional activator
MGDVLASRGPPPVLSFTLFGRFTIVHRIRGLVPQDSRKAQELLGYLLLHRRPHNREVLAHVLWGAAPGDPRKLLRQTLFQINGTLAAEDGEPELLRVGPDWVDVDEDYPTSIDAVELEEAVRAARDRPGADLDHAAAARLHQAVSLYRGDLLEGCYSDWCLYERERYRALYIAGLEKLFAHCEAAGCTEEALSIGALILEQDRAHERTHAALIRLRHAAGDRTGAIRQFLACTRALRDELDVSPSPSTVALYRAACEDTPPDESVYSQNGHGRGEPGLEDVAGALATATRLLGDVIRRSRAFR